MQSIARVNRVFRDKPDGLGVDYLGLAHELKAAAETPALGFNQAAIARSGEAAVRDVYANADRASMRSDRSVRYDNVFLWAAGERP